MILLIKMQKTIDKINKLKIEKNAIILAHFYQPEEIQEIADFVGDSLELSKYAYKCTSDIIIVCGVDFMAGSVKILNPSKKVLIPVGNATCPMANMVTAKDIINLRKEHPNAAVVTYINSTVEVKAVSDICCTSSNAINIVNSLPNEEIIFVPDNNLGSYVARFTDKKIILFNGYCPVHNDITIKDVLQAKYEHPKALFVVHPECRSEIIDMADFTGSTAKIINYIGESDINEFIIGTEEGILTSLKKKYPNKKFYKLTNNFICFDMKKIRLQDLLNTLELEQYEITLDEEMRIRALNTLKRMINL